MEIPLFTLILMILISNLFKLYSLFYFIIELHCLELPCRE